MGRQMKEVEKISDCCKEQLKEDRLPELDRTEDDDAVQDYLSLLRCTLNMKGFREKLRERLEKE